MSRYRKIDVRLWTDAKVRRLSDDGKLILLYLLTHPAMTSMGALPGVVPGLAHGLKWSPERFWEALSELLANGMAKVDDEAGLIAFPNFLKYNAPENGNVVKGWASAFDLLPECKLKTQVLSWAYASLKGRTDSLAKAFTETFGKPFPEPVQNPSPNQEQEQEPEQEPKPEPVSALEEKELDSTRVTEAMDDEIPLDPCLPEEADRFLDDHGVTGVNRSKARHLLVSGKLLRSTLENMAAMQ